MQTSLKMAVHRLAVLFKPSTNAKNYGRKKKKENKKLTAEKTHQNKVFKSHHKIKLKPQCNAQHGHFKTHFT